MTVRLNYCTSGQCGECWKCQEETTVRRLLLEAYGPEPRQAFYRDKPCELVTYHAPTPVITEYHHTKPVFLQNRLFGRIIYPADLWVCSNCHEAVHAWLYWLLGERKQPPIMGRNAKAEAERTFAWYTTTARSLKGTDVLSVL